MSNTTTVIATGPAPAYVVNSASRTTVVGAAYVKQNAAAALVARARGWLRFILSMGAADGDLSAAGASTLAITWTQPTTNTDGSAIGTITGQTIYYDTVSRMGTGVAYANSQAVGDGVSTSATITGLLAATTYYYAVTVTVAGVESDAGIEQSGASTP